MGYEYPLVVPAIQGRTAIDFPPGLALGGMFLAVVGGEAPNRTASCNLTRGYKAFSATATLFTLRVRSSGDVQVWGEGGVGVGPGSTFVVVNYTAERSRDRRRESFLSSRRQRATIHGLRYSADHTSVRAS